MPIINAAGLKLIENFEGCRLHAYDDGTGVCTIGYGHTGSDVWMGQSITESQAASFLNSDLSRAEHAVEELIEVNLTPNQFSALVSFVYNVGAGAFATSTLRALINKNDFAGAADQFVRWDDPGKPESAGLLRRREAEKALFCEAGPP